MLRTGKIGLINAGRNSWPWRADFLLFSTYTGRGLDICQIAGARYK